MMAACKNHQENQVNNTKSEAPFIDLLNEKISISHGTSRKDFLLLAGLSDGEEVQQLSYFATLCGSMETWKIQSGATIYIQGSFIEKEGSRKEPYIIAVIKMKDDKNTKEKVLWSGPNLFDGQDIYSTTYK